MEECSICQENILTTQNIITLGVCSHKFHALCIQTWATVRNTCPLCREVFTEAQEINRVFPTLFAMAIIFPMEDQIQRISLAFAFLKHLLLFFPTSIEFNQHKNLIVTFGENYSIGHYRLPLLCYATREDIRKQCTYLKTRFRALVGESRGLERHPFVKSWKEKLLLDPVASTFFYQKQNIGLFPHYYQLPQAPHTS